MQDELKRETWFRCDRSGFRVGLIVIGPKGAVQFWFSAFPDDLGGSCVRKFSITPVDLGYHALEPQYKGQTVMENDCDILKKPCYCDGTSLGASDLFDSAMSLNQDVIWQKLEEVYHDRFEVTS